MKPKKPHKNIIYYAICSFSLGILIIIISYVVNIKKFNLPLTFQSIVTLHNINFLHYIIDLLPLIFTAFIILPYKTFVLKELKIKEKISEQKDEILEDIINAKRLQTGLCPRKEFLDEVLKSYIILEIPENIVSGDFFWVKKHNGKTIVACADCTGHGVSGALMHMLGAALLNDIVNRDIYETASDILDLEKEAAENHRLYKECMRSVADAEKTVKQDTVILQGVPSVVRVDTLEIDKVRYVRQWRTRVDTVTVTNEVTNVVKVADPVYKDQVDDLQKELAKSEAEGKSDRILWGAIGAILGLVIGLLGMRLQ